MGLLFKIIFEINMLQIKPVFLLPFISAIVSEATRFLTLKMALHTLLELGASSIVEWFIISKNCKSQSN